MELILFLHKIWAGHGPVLLQQSSASAGQQMVFIKSRGKNLQQFILSENISSGK
jgi:hypothetical protein